MWTLIRYEMRKTMQIKIISVSLIAIFEFLLLFGSTSGNIAVMGLAGVFLFFFSFVAFLLFGLSSMASLSKDLSTNQGYMLFMLPKPSYTFLLAKILESLLSTFCLGLLLYFLFLFDIFFFSVDVAGFMDVFKMVWGLTMESRLGDFIHFMISIALIYAGFWLYMSCLAVLCVTVQASFFRGKILAFLISIIVFLFLAVNIVEWCATFSEKIVDLVGLDSQMNSHLQILFLTLVSLLCFGLSVQILAQTRNY